jgi:crotonobetainyl-CoA:carnitine CoA-transferase CaiB-like acyl-CoA transferase
LTDAIEQVLKTAPADVWVARLTKAGVPAGPVLSIPDYDAARIAALRETKAVG